MSGIKKGQRLRVVLEGEVGGTADGCFQLGDGYGNVIYEDAEHVVSVEVLPDREPEPEPEAEWRSGDVVVDGSGRVFVRWRGRWRHLPQGAGACLMAGKVGHNVPIRPQTLLVRDGKPVQS